jgi:hypothetical protein
MSDFFVSYTKPDEAWAEWISWILEEADFSVTVQAWDFGAGGNFVLEMQRAATEATRTLAVLLYCRRITSLRDFRPRNGQRPLLPIPMA